MAWIIPLDTAPVINIWPVIMIMSLDTAPIINVWPVVYYD